MTGTTSNDARGPGAGRLDAPPDDPAPSVPGVAHLAHTGMVRISPDAGGPASVSMTPEGEAPRVSAVIPTMNEAANLSDVLSRLPECVDEVIIVDGHSTDDTIAVARAVRPNVRVVVQTSRGKGNALACGFAMCSSGIVPLPQPKERVVGGHAVLAVGYSDPKGQLTVRNSWGSGWGDQGYFYMPYEYLTGPDTVADASVVNGGYLASDFWAVQKTA